MAEPVTQSTLTAGAVEKQPSGGTPPPSGGSEQTPPADQQTPEQKVAAEAAAKAAAEAAAEAEKNLTPEQKAAKEKEAADAKAKADADKAPENYEAFKLPEGMPLNEAANTEFLAVAKEANLTQANAQKLVDLAAKHFGGPEHFEKLQAESWAGQREKWVAEVKADKEVGGAKFDEAQEHVARAVKTFAPGEDFKPMLAILNTGWGDNPTLFRFLHRIGKAMSEDKFVEGQSSSEQNPLAKMYPSAGKK